MVTIPHITQNMFYIILAAIAVIGLIVLLYNLDASEIHQKKLMLYQKRQNLKNYSWLKRI